MKRGTIDHPKMSMLSAELGIPLYAAVGIMESLWHWSSRYAIQADVGKWNNVAIARGIGWTDDPDCLVRALIKTKWLDEVDGPARLVIHDVKDHADNTWKQNLEDAGLKWWDGSRPRTKGQGKRCDRKQSKQKEKLTSRQLQDNFKGTSKVLPQPEPISSIQSQYPNKENTLSGKPDDSPPDRNFKQEAREVLQFLNQETGHDYREIDTNIRLIEARLKSGNSSQPITVDDCKKIIIEKSKKWKFDPNMADYLRPATLFGKENFEQYLGQARKKRPVAMGSTLPTPEVLNMKPMTTEEQEASQKAMKAASALLPWNQKKTYQEAAADPPN